MLQREYVKLQYVPKEEYVYDVLTKPLSHIKFEHFLDKPGVDQRDLLGNMW